MEIQWRWYLTFTRAALSVTDVEALDATFRDLNYMLDATRLRLWLQRHMRLYYDPTSTQEIISQLKSRPVVGSYCMARLNFRQMCLSGAGIPGEKCLSQLGVCLTYVRRCWLFAVLPYPGPNIAAGDKLQTARTVRHAGCFAACVGS